MRSAQSGIKDYGRPHSTWKELLDSWDNDEFALDPTRLTLICGSAGFDGTQFKGLLAERFDIQINKTSRNSVLLQTNINNTRSDAALLVKALTDLSREIEQRLAQGGPSERAAFDARVKSLMTDVPDLPNFSRFHDVFRDDPKGASNEGHMREAFFMAYDEANCEYIKLASPEIDERLKDGPPLVSANFVIPYPPGFPIMVPGQVIAADTITFMRKLDVKEIHGYHASRGLKLLKPSALTPRELDRNGLIATENRHGSFLPVSCGEPVHPAVPRRRPRCRHWAASRWQGTASAWSPPPSSSARRWRPWRSTYGVKLELNNFAKSLFYYLFMYGVGLRVGPSFINSLKGDGIKFAFLAVLCSVLGLALAVAMARLFDLPPGAAGGILAGAMTMSAAIGSAEQAVTSGVIALPEGMTAEQVSSMIALSYGVTYICGTVGIILICKYLPKWWGVDARAAAKRYEEEFGVKNLDERGLTGYRPGRHSRVSRSPILKPPVNTVAQFRAKYPMYRVINIVQGNTALAVTPDAVLEPGSVVAIGARLEDLTERMGLIGPEVADQKALNIPLDEAEILVTNEAVDGQSAQGVPPRGVRRSGGNC